MLSYKCFNHKSENMTSESNSMSLFKHDENSAESNRLIIAYYLFDIYFLVQGW